MLFEALKFCSDDYIVCIYFVFFIIAITFLVDSYIIYIFFLWRTSKRELLSFLLFLNLNELCVVLDVN